MRKLKLYGMLIGIVGLVAVIRRIPGPRPRQLDGFVKTLALACGIPVALVIIVAVVAGGALALRWWRHSSAMMRIEERAAEARIPVIDRSDVLGSLVVTDQKMVELERGTVRSLQGELETMIPELNLAEQRRSLIASGRGWPKQAALESAMTTTAVNWPMTVPLSMVQSPSADRLLLGVTVHDDGTTETIYKSLRALVHVKIGGSTGSGKSKFLQSLAWQLCNAGSVKVVLLDVESVTLSPFANSPNALYPLADSEADISAVLADLGGELERRKALFSQHRGVDSIDRYNAVTGDSLPRIAVLCDETMSLLADDAITNSLKNLAMRGRKWGFSLILSSLMWRVTDLPKVVRSQMTTRVCFRVDSDSDSRVVLGQAGAEKISDKDRGRAWAVLPGRRAMEVQTPLIDDRSIEVMYDLADGPVKEIPRVLATPSNGGLSTEAIERIEAGSIMPDTQDIMAYALILVLADIGEKLEHITEQLPGGVYYAKCK